MADNVLIIGAGISGLTAGCLLTDAGVPFKILEARAVPGGRIRTVRAPVFDDDLYVEFGGEYVPNIHYRLAAYLFRFKIEVMPVTRSFCLQKIILFRGRRAFSRLSPSGRTYVWPHGFPGSKADKAPGDMENDFIGKFLTIVGDPWDAGWPDASIYKYDQMSVADLLQQQHATPDEVALIQLGLNSLDGEGFAVDSALEHIADGVGFRGFQTSGSIAGGSDTLPRAMAQFLAPHIEYKAPVHAITSAKTGYTVSYGDGKTATCTHLIVAVPFSVLRKITFTPELPMKTAQVIAQQRNTSVTRTFLQFKERVWEDMGLNGAADTDQQVMGIYPGVPTKSSRGILESYTAGEFARQLAALPELERVQVVLEQMDRVIPGVARLYEKKYASVCWDKEPWAFGAYAFYEKGEMSTLYPNAATAVERIHFAGDHTTPQPGWMDSAIRSGERAAREVMVQIGCP